MNKQLPNHTERLSRRYRTGLNHHMPLCLVTQSICDEMREFVTKCMKKNNPIPDHDETHFSIQTVEMQQKSWYIFI